ncbi:alpha/beta fold hydrolase [Streptomyces sp. NPDC002564]|uniref:alpha/beta fold hydrolase n=1 Tax=Streptomyces sp. NPDC002564 TaxID=3364649 RepID=UPI0036AC2E7E
MPNRSASFFLAGTVGAATLTAASAPSPLYPTYQRLWNLSTFTLTVIFAVYVLALLAALLTLGSLSDRTGRRPVACAALTLLATGMLLFATAEGAGDLMTARIVQGLAVGTAAGTTTALIMDTAPNPRLGSTISSAVPPLGIAIGAALAGTLVQFAPLPRQLVFWTLAALYLALAALIWLIPEHPRPPSPTSRTLWRSLLPSAQLPPQTRPIFITLLPSISATWALGGLYLSLGSSILTTVLDVHSHFATGLILSLFFAAGTAGTITSALAAPPLRAWLGLGPLATGVLITIAAMLTATLPLYVTGSLIAGFGFGATFRSAVHALGQAAPPARRGQVFATMYIVSYLAFSVPALAAGLAAERYGLKPTAVAFASLDIALVLLALLTGTTRTHPQNSKNQHRRHTAPPLLSRTFATPRHTTHYLECGPTDGPLMFFLHGWPGIALLWRAQMEAFAADGWHCIAPDLRGYGKSSAPPQFDAYTVEEAVKDLTELHDHLGARTAVWIGHDWGSTVAGAMAAHEPHRCRGLVLTSWAYFPTANSLTTLVPLVDRQLYPADRYPDGQWDYYRYYTTHFHAAVADLDADPAATLASIYQPGNPASTSTIPPAATVTRDGGRFGAAHRAPPTAADPALWPPADFDALVQAFKAHGFSPPCAWYTNDDANTAYALTAPHGGRLAQPVLFINGEWDAICTISGNRQGDPMRAACADLTITRIPAGHWLPLETKAHHIEAIRTWLHDRNLR